MTYQERIVVYVNVHQNPTNLDRTKFCGKVYDPNDSTKRPTITDANSLESFERGTTEMDEFEESVPENAEPDEPQTPTKSKPSPPQTPDRTRVSFDTPLASPIPIPNPKQVEKVMTLTELARPESLTEKRNLLRTNGGLLRYSYEKHLAQISENCFASPKRPKTPQSNVIARPEPCDQDIWGASGLQLPLIQSALNGGKKLPLPKHHATFVGRPFSNPNDAEIGSALRANLYQNMDALRGKFLASPTDERETEIPAVEHAGKDMVLTMQSEHFAEEGTVDVSFSSLMGMAHMNSLMKKPTNISALSKRPMHKGVPLTQPKPVHVRFI